ncbi:MAG: DUF4249 family protein [Cyclobacteriaceae bacterium]|nr:DUF4249 family protein [Cyclobacteriaceae bacterium]
MKALPVVATSSIITTLSPLLSKGPSTCFCFPWAFAAFRIIKVLKSIPYFENTFLPGSNDAIVKVEDLTDNMVYNFEKGEEDGVYIWEPSASQPTFGTIGNEYKLSVQMGSGIYESFSKMNRVPAIDSINFRFEEGNSFFPDSYFVGVFARDFVGSSDTYWIKAWKNGTYLNKPSEINISYDAGGSPGAIIDGIAFIQPIRDGINPFDQDADDNFIAPYEPGDSVYVEIHSVNNDAYTFLYEVAVQTNRPGGFAELFAQPLANVPSNVFLAAEASDASKPIGFFNVSAVSALGRLLDPNNLPPKGE